MSIQALVVEGKRMFLADTVSGALDDYERNDQGVYRRYVHNEIEPEYISGVQEELAKKFSTKEVPAVWRTLSLTALPDEFTQAWLDGEIAKE